jgi:hypothetical protein
MNVLRLIFNTLLELVTAIIFKWLLAIVRVAITIASYLLVIGIPAPVYNWGVRIRKNGARETRDIEHVTIGNRAGRRQCSQVAGARTGVRVIKVRAGLALVTRVGARERWQRVSFN